MQKIIPAILTPDSKDLREKLQLFEGESEWMHIDIMDGKFVPAVSVGVGDLKDAGENFDLELHLMVQNPEDYIEECASAGAARIIIHKESQGNLVRALEKSKVHGLETGIAINPSTSLESLVPYESRIDFVIVMGVHPGSQGQEFIPSILEKIKVAKRDFSHLRIGIDGGVGALNISKILEVGADYVVVGSKIFDTKDPKEAFRKLQEMI